MVGRDVGNKGSIVVSNRSSRNTLTSTGDIITGVYEVEGPLVVTPCPDYFMANRTVELGPYYNER